MAVKDGDRAELVLRPGAYPDTDPNENLRGKPFERTVKGVVRSFKQDGITRWEISTDDPTHPAIGFDPKTAKFKD